MLIVGLTGGIGAGKTTVAEALARRGAIVVDVDGLGRQIIGHGGSAVDDVVARFGERVRTAEGDIDRAALASIVFADPQALADLNDISHPRINELIDATVDELPDDTIVVLEMAVLVESKLGWDNRHRYEVVAVVEAPENVRVERLIDRGMTIADARARIENQVGDEDRRAVANYVITNIGSIDNVVNSVGELWADLQRLHAEKNA
ncbi:MAG: dephospho-CoA kinase [Actinomycetia bacterium]|nr:dephospho-CoA kinase [Actinomycetes bacterium]MCP4958346.1 dephospho-CoA kinase [Actinomycetes bacterium]